MIYVEEQENYANAPIVVGVSNFNYANGNVNPFDVITGLIDRGQQTAEKGRALVETFKGGDISTNIGGFDINVSPDSGQPTKKPFYKSPIFIGGSVVVVLVGGYLIYNYYSKKKS